jgi:tetratricopeptide (TPR) repeat protein
VKRLAIILFSVLFIVGGAAFWLLRDRTPPSAELPVAIGETVQRVLPDSEGKPQVWTITKQEIAMEDLPDRVLPQPAPRESAPGPHTDSARALDARALEAWRQGELEEALALFASAVEADPDDAVPRSNYGRLLLLMTANEQALGQLERAAELTPDDPRVWVDLLSYYERNILLERAAYARERARELLGPRGLVRDPTGLWTIDGESVFP